MLGLSAAHSVSLELAGARSSGGPVSRCRMC